VTCVYRPLMRDNRGVASPLNAINGFRPNVEKSRLNQTTSGLTRRSAFISRTTLEALSNDQHRITLKPSSSS
jgi:hypothetical protein